MGFYLRGNMDIVVKSFGRATLWESHFLNIVYIGLVWLSNILNKLGFLPHLPEAQNGVTI